MLRSRGCLKTFHVDDEGIESVLTLSIENWWAGDLYSFLTGKASVYSIKALEQTDLVIISKNKLERIYQTVPQFNVLFRMLLEKAFIAQQERITGNMADTGEKRYIKLQARYPDFEKRVPLKDIVVYLGITPQYLSMIRKKISRARLSSTS